MSKYVYIEKNTVKGTEIVHKTLSDLMANWTDLGAWLYVRHTGSIDPVAVREELDLRVEQLKEIVKLDHTYNGAYTKAVFIRANIVHHYLHMEEV